jgi:transcriptional regulator with XRE-family HTH domain
MDEHWRTLEAGLGSRLALERRKLQLTQELLAEVAGVTARSIKRYEAGESTMATDVVYRLASAGVDMRFVLFR